MKVKLAKLIDIPNGWSEHELATAFGHEPIMLKRTHTGFYAFINECPHQGRRMNYAKDAFLETPEGYVICPAHGATFNTQSGLCQEGPCLGESLKKLEVIIEQNTLYLQLEGTYE